MFVDEFIALVESVIPEMDLFKTTPDLQMSLALKDCTFRQFSQVTTPSLGLVDDLSNRAFIANYSYLLDRIPNKRRKFDYV